MVDNGVTSIIKVHVNAIRLESGKNDACDILFINLKQRLPSNIQGEFTVYNGDSLVRDWESSVEDIHFREPCCRL